jgi:peptidoglycan glycosyltransferase
MNAPLRRLAILVMVMFCVLLAGASKVQYFDAPELAHGPQNSRTFFRQFDRPRGKLLVGGRVIAQSIQVKDSYGFQRTYAQSDGLYSAVTGYFSVIYGTAGLERTESSLLNGSDNQLFYRRLSDILTNHKTEGASVELTILPAAQKAAWKALGNQRGAVVAMDPTTGSILAMVSKPGYDPNRLAGHNRANVAKAWTSLTKDSSDPMINRAIGGDLYPPGSVFKLVTASAALSSGRYNPDSVIPGPAKLTLPGTTTTLPNDWNGSCGANDQTTIANALRISCNTAFGWLGMDVGAQAMQAQAQAFGIGSPLQVPLSVTPSVFPATLNKPQTAQSAIGQYNVRVTPLQVAMITAAIANGGVMMKPNLIKVVRTTDLQVIQRPEPEKLGNPISTDVAAQLTSMMEGVVSSGTGTAAQISGVTVAGKTGTAEHGTSSSPHAWFTAFAPSENPKIVVTVVVEDGGKLGDAASGGRVAAPIARQVIEAVLNP